jgi:hypothetical protein
MVGPDVEGPHTRGLAAEIVTSVLDDQSQIQLAGKVHGKLDLCNVTCVY